jgi:hypothetical protein
MTHMFILTQCGFVYYNKFNVNVFTVFQVHLTLGAHWIDEAC